MYLEYATPYRRRTYSRLITNIHIYIISYRPVLLRTAYGYLLSHTYVAHTSGPALALAHETCITAWYAYNAYCTVCVPRYRWICRWLTDAWKSPDTTCPFLSFAEHSAAPPRASNSFLNRLLFIASSKLSWVAILFTVRIPMLRNGIWWRN